MASLAITIPLPIIRNLSKLNVEQLKLRLDQEQVPYSCLKGKVNKPVLLALCALSQQGVLMRGKLPDPKLLTKATEWCHPTRRVPQLTAELMSKGLDIAGLKWNLIEILIRAEVEDAEAAMTDLKGHTLDAPVVAKPSISKNPHPAVVNLLITILYSHDSQSQGKALIPTSAGVNRLQLLDQLNQFPAFLNDARLAEELASNPQKQLLSDVCSTFGGQCTLATSNMRIDGFTKSVPQFVIAKTTPFNNWNARYENQKRFKGFKSIIRFHGTPLAKVGSILHIGFRPTRNPTLGTGLFMAEEPSTSYWFSARRMELAMSLMWKNGMPGQLWGALFGCEVAGLSRPQDDGLPGGTHVILELNYIMSRFLFLLPRKEMALFTSNVGHQVGLRCDVP